MKFSNKIFSIATLGCRANQSEGESIAASLERRGWAIADESGGPAPDMVVIVTCSITAVADQKAKKIIRKARRDNPRAVVVACGCYAQGVSSDEARAMGVDILVGNGLKHRIPDLAEEFAARGSFIEEKRDLAENSWDDLALDAPRMHSRAFVKIQDGCDHRCSYCIVPSVRGMPVSRPLKDIVAEVRRIAASGCKEAILTGINIGRYRDGDATLSTVIRALSDVAGIDRLRIGSIEPFSLTDDLLTAFAESESFCRHLHIPLQSGDDEILKLMRRGYDSATFEAVAEKCRVALGDDLHLGTDLIVGFPGESEGAFERSLALLQKLRFGRIHVFPYSPRGGTIAADMPGRLDSAAMKERTKRSLDFAAERLHSYAERWIGREEEIFVEESNEFLEGWTRHYVRARVTNNDSIHDKGIQKKLVAKACDEGILTGEYI